MKLSSKDHKAIAWYCGNYDLRPQLSTPPIMYFKNGDGNKITQDLAAITLEYKAWNEEDKRRRAHEKKIESAKLNSRRVIK